MREIKFRVFDKDYRKMHIVGKDGHDSLTCWDGKIQYYNLQNGEGSGEHGSYILMQYTGLKDKNGKEIYEGDVLQLAHPFKDRQYTGKVIFERGSFIAEDFWMTHYDNPSDFTEGLEHVEVIGNIYEHPHLLEESK